MTDEDFVRAWFSRETGVEFRRDEPLYMKMLELKLGAHVLETCFDEGLGTCSCRKMEPGKDIRFYLSEDLFMAICPNCDTWAVYPTKGARRNYGHE